MSLKAYQPLR